LADGKGRCFRTGPARTTNHGLRPRDSATGTEPATWAYKRIPQREAEKAAQKHRRSLESASLRGHRPVWRYRDGQRSPVCWSLIHRHLRKHGWSNVLFIPRDREMYGESSIALPIRRQVCDHSITSYHGAFWLAFGGRSVGSNTRPGKVVQSGRATSVVLGNFLNSIK